VPIDTPEPAPAVHPVHTVGFVEPVQPTLPEGAGHAGGVSPDKVKSWFKANFNLPKWKMEDDGTTILPTLPKLDDTSKISVALSDIMTAAGIPSSMQGSEGVEIPASFKMHGGHFGGASSFGGLGASASSHFGSPGPGAEAWRPAVHAVMLQSGGLVFDGGTAPLPNRDKWVGGGFSRSPLGVWHPEWGEQITDPYGRPQTLRYGGEAGVDPSAFQSWEDAIVRQIQTESSGDPNAVNLKDINAQQGHPSRGLLQFIPSTYQSYNISGRPFPDPYGEIAAIMPYVISRWGVGPDGSPNRIGRGMNYRTGGMAGRARPIGFQGGGQAGGSIWDRIMDFGHDVGSALGPMGFWLQVPADVRTGMNWGKASGWQKAGVGLDIASAIPLPLGVAGKGIGAGLRGIGDWSEGLSASVEAAEAAGRAGKAPSVPPGLEVHPSAIPDSPAGIFGAPPGMASLSDISQAYSVTPGGISTEGKLDPMKVLVRLYGWNIGDTRSVGTRGVMGPGSPLHNAMGGLASRFDRGGAAMPTGKMKDLLTTGAWWLQGNVFREGFPAPSNIGAAPHFQDGGLADIAPPDVGFAGGGDAGGDQRPSLWQALKSEFDPNPMNWFKDIDDTTPPEEKKREEQEADRAVQWDDPMVGNVVNQFLAPFLLTPFGHRGSTRRLTDPRLPGSRIPGGPQTGSSGPQPTQFDVGGRAGGNLPLDIVPGGQAEDDAIAAAIKAEGVDPAIWAGPLKVLVGRESGGQQTGFWETAARQHGYTDVNTGGNEAIGVAQVTPGTARGVGIDPYWLTAPTANLRAAIRYIMQAYAAPAANRGPGEGGLGKMVDAMHAILNVQQADPDMPPHGYQKGGGAGSGLLSLGLGFLTGIGQGLGLPQNLFDLSKWLKHKRGMKMCGGGHMFTEGGKADDCPWCQIDKSALKKADGGEIPWLERSHIGRDSIFAMLEPGEFIVRRAIAQQFMPQLHALNAGMHFGGLKFALGGAAVGGDQAHTGDSGVLQVIYSDLGSGEKIGEAAGYGIVGPGTSQPQYYGGDWAGHTGHVHTSFATGPGGEFYGMPKGTEIHGGTSGGAGGAAGFPDWVYELGNMYGVDPSTYSGHQEASGYNRGIDWWPHGKGDMSGQSYTPEDRQTLTEFASAMASAGAGAAPDWGGSLGAGGDGGDYDYGDDGDDSDEDYYGGLGGDGFDSDGGDFGFHGGGYAGFGGGGHTSTAAGYSIGYGGDGDDQPSVPAPLPKDTSPVPVTVVGGYPAPPPPAPGATAADPGYVPGQPIPELGPGPHAGGPGEPKYSPYGPYPPGLTQDQYDKWKAAWDKRIQDDQEQGGKSSEIQQKINDLNGKIAIDKQKQHDLDVQRDNIQRAGGAITDQQEQIIEKANAADLKVKNDYIELQQLQNEQTRAKIKGEEHEPYPEAPGMKGRKAHDVKGDPMAEKLGKGFIQGMFQELGFPDVFGKPFTEWGIWKMAMAGAGFGVNLLQNVNPNAPAFGGSGGGQGPPGLIGSIMNLHALGGPKIGQSADNPVHVKGAEMPMPQPPVPRDEGGWLHPGQTGINTTRQPELVLTPSQSAHLASGGGLSGPSVVSAARYSDTRQQTGPGGAPAPPAAMPGQQGVASAVEGLIGSMLPSAKGFLQNVTNNHFDNRGNISTESERAVTKIAAPQPRPGTMSSGAIAHMR
jgi:SLT domain-containing protein